MQETVTIPLKEYNELKHKAGVLDEIVEEEGLTIVELEKIKMAERSKKMTEEEFYLKHPELRN